MILKILKTIIVMLWFTLISACSYKYEEYSNSEVNNYKVISIKAGSSKINKLNKKPIEEKDEILIIINRTLNEGFEEWVFNKFKIKNSNNEANINIHSIEGSLEEVMVEEGVKSIFFGEDKKFKMYLIFDIEFLIDNQFRKKLSIKSEIEFNLRDNLTIDIRKKIIYLTTKKLLFTIDEKVNSELKKDNFKELVDFI